MNLNPNLEGSCKFLVQKIREFMTKIKKMSACFAMSNNSRQRLNPKASQTKEPTRLDVGLGGERGTPALDIKRGMQVSKCRMVNRMASKVNGRCA
jgi:hypothetical protein